MYVRKQSLDHRPICWISQRGSPAAAAVVAAPMRNECVDVLPSFPGGRACRSKLFSRRAVRNVPSWYVNSGPCLRCSDSNRTRAVTGQRGDWFDVKRMMQPCLKGSDFELLMLIAAVS